MRSIRRSLLGYLLLLLALALGAVGGLVDRFAHGAMRTREASESERIEQAFKVREQEAKTKFDADLMAETKVLADKVHYTTLDLLGQRLDSRKGQPPGPPRLPEPQLPVKAPDEEAREYRLRTNLLQIGTPPSLLPSIAGFSALHTRLDVSPQSRRYNPFPGWTEYDAPQVVERTADALHRAFDDEEHAGVSQFTLVGTYPGRTNRKIAVAHSTAADKKFGFLVGDLASSIAGNVSNGGATRAARVDVDLPLDPVWLEPNHDVAPRVSDIDVPDHGRYRQVVMGTGVSGRQLTFFVVVPAPPPASPTPRYPSYQFPSFRGADLYLHVFVHHARPYSELDARLAADQNERDEQLARVQAETREELAHLRARLVVIGTVTFAALVLGGWFFVARGLAPLRTLSDAVSRVSEKDFRLPVVAGDLGRELVPIHARITQTLTLLQRAFAREKQSVADISHELRTPIASLLATIDVALRKPRTPEQYRTTLEECRLISRQLGQLVERIMTLASLDAGNDHTHVARTDAGELAAGCAAVIRPLAAANNLSITVHADEDVNFDTDPGKLREVLMNLLHNAVEYNSPNGTIELTVRRAGETAVFEVRDSGIGMTPDVRDRIFERFFRADASRHATGVHAGLGLAIVKEYVARLNGTIAVESEPGVGTIFRVTLPAPIDALPAERPKPSRAAVAGS